MSPLSRRLILPSSKRSLSPVEKAPLSPDMTIPHRAAPPAGKMAPTSKRTTSAHCKRTLVSLKPLLLLVLLMATETFGQVTFGSNTNKASFHCASEDMKPDNNRPAVFGTVHYAESSAICLSALHAGFLTTAGGDVNYTSSGENAVVGTVRNRVLSLSKDKKERTFRFAGEKPTVNMDSNGGTIILHDSYVDDGEETKVHLRCFDGHGLTKWKHTKLGRNDDVPPEYIEAKAATNSHAFVCEGDEPWQDSRAVFPLPPCSRTRTRFCSKYGSAVATYTGSVGSSLTVDLHPDDPADLITNLFVKRLPDVPSTTPDFPHNKVFTSLEVGNDGIYIAGNSANFNKISNKEETYFDIMVRDCPDQRWGPTCAYWCPDCQNGGQCHPLTGKCVCAPGFKGHTCSSGCPKDKFGPDCKFHCRDLHNPSSSKQQHCLGLTACVPFPRGCSCLPGYKGPRCEQECGKNEYGCGCFYQCNYCLEESCNGWNGQCTHGCKNDVACDENGVPLDLPRLEQQPQILDITDKSVKIRFKTVENRDSINVLNYIVQYFDVNSQVWKTGQDVKNRVVGSSEWETTLVSDLHPGSKYFFRVLVNTSLGFNDERSNKRILLSEPLTTLCTGGACRSLNSTMTTPADVTISCGSNINCLCAQNLLTLCSTPLLEEQQPGHQSPVQICKGTLRAVNDYSGVAGFQSAKLEATNITSSIPKELKSSSAINVVASQSSAVFSAENETHNGSPCSISIKLTSFIGSNLKDGRSISFQPTVSVSTLTPDTCYAVEGSIKNSVNEVPFKTAEFCTLPNPPANVENLKVDPLAESAEIFFEKPEGKVTYYNITIKRSQANTCRYISNSSPQTLNIDVHGLPVRISHLSPNQNYRACVQAGNKGGPGSMKCTLFKTRSKAPDNSLQITDCTKFSCEVEVKGNCAQYHSDGITVHAYLQGFQACDNHRWNQTVLAQYYRHPNKYRAYFQNIPCGIALHISFTLANEAGKGKSVMRNFTTISCDPPQPRIDIVTVSSTTSLTLYWNDACPSYGPIKKYEIRYGLLTGRWILNTTTEKCHLDYKHRCFTIEGLQPRNKYEMQIRVDNGLISGWSEKRYGTTIETAPGPPKDVVADRNEMSLGFKILLPINTNGQLINCTVHLSSGRSCTAELEKGRTFAYCEINGLNQGTTYTGHSRCFNSKEGESLKVHTATLPVPPHLNTKLQFFSELSTDTTFTISLPELDLEGEGMSEVAVLLRNASSQTNPDFSYTRHFIEEIERKESTYSSEDNRHRRNTESLDKCHVKEKGPVRVAALIEIGKNQLKSPGERFTVGDGKEYGEFCNAPLTKGSSYHVATVACTKLEGERRCTENKLPHVVHIELYAPLPWAALVLPVLLFLVVLLVLILYRKGYLQKYLFPKGTSSQEPHPHGDNIPITGPMNSQKPRVDLPSEPDLPPTPILPSALPIRSLPQHPRHQGTLPSMEGPSDYPGHLFGSKAPPYFDEDSAYTNIGLRIPEEEVESFLNDITVRGMFDQFLHIPVICTEKSENDGQNASNKKKNRFKNNLPYDQTRVRLSIIGNDPYSDYINANHVQGCGGELKYIATQGPKDDKVCTIGDFWRMVREQDVKAIIMVANFVEGDRVKVGEYFNPKRVMEWEGQYVSVMREKRMPHYTVSTIKVEAVDGSTFEVKHYHYLSWPDHNVPLEARSLACMIREVIRTHRQGSLVAHCSAGIGRTGTVLLVLLLHEMLETQNAIDPIRILAQIRHCRGRLLENANQFTFALQLFDEVLFGKRTLRSKGDISANFNEIFQHQSQAEFLRLCSLTSGLSYPVVQENELASLNRNPKILPSDSRRVYLEMVSGSANSQYINAVRLHSLEPPNAFITTEYPMTNTCAAFWRMLYGENSPLLVMINTFDSHEKNYPYLFPVLGDSLQVEEITVILRETSQPLPFLLQHTIELCYHENVHTMLVYIFQSWPYEDELPSSLSDLVNLAELLQVVLQKNSENPLVLCCADGVRGCGVLAGVLKILNSLMNNDEVDVYRTTVSLRRDREQFIPTQRQYNFLYQAARYHIQQNHPYENPMDSEDQEPTYANIGSFGQE